MLRHPHHPPERIQRRRLEFDISEVRFLVEEHIDGMQNDVGLRTGLDRALLDILPYKLSSLAFVLFQSSDYGLQRHRSSGRQACQP